MRLWTTKATAGGWAIDGAADLSGGYGRFQAGSGDTLVTTTAHRYAESWSMAPSQPGSWSGTGVTNRSAHDARPRPRHYADNRWDTIARPYRAAGLDTRGSAGRSRAIREAVLRVLGRGVTNPGAIGEAARAAMLPVDPNRDQLTLWPMRNYPEVL